MSRRRVRRAVGVSLALLGLSVTFPNAASASSHREAPLISQDPAADNTDLYVFRDPTDAGSVIVVANYIGLEQPAGGPNWPRFADDVMYEIHIDNNGDVADDITYQFRFHTFIDNGDTFLYNLGPIKAPDIAPQNVRQEYDVRLIDKNGSRIVGSNLRTPPVNIGPRSTPNYEAALAQTSHMKLSNGALVFAGQRKDPFFVDLGSAFDLLALRPFNTAHAIPKPAAPGRDGLAGKNVHSIVLRLPISSVTKNGNVPTTVNSKDSVIGVWASASRQSTRVLSGTGTQSSSGQWVQVSRLGLPLINEIFIPLKAKDRWNARLPKNDLDKDGFANYILNPEPAQRIKGLYGINPPGNPRTSDILPIIQGAGAGLSAANYLPPADLLRVNLAVPVTAKPNRLGVLGGDAQGFPNGRRLGDDVVDVFLRLAAGGTPFTPAFNHSPNNALGDGVDASDYPLLNHFPFVGTPVSGYDQPATG